MFQSTSSSTQFRTSPTKPTTNSSNTPLAQLLHQADQYSTQFNSFHRSSLSNVQAIASANVQLQNLLALPDVRRTRSTGDSMKERGMVKVQETIEEALSLIRQDLAKMETVVENLSHLLFQADIWLSDSNTALNYGLNPKQSLQHVGGLFSSYQAELIRLRELLADLTTEEISVDDFVSEWKVMKEVDAGAEAELSDLVDVLGSWDAAGTGDAGTGIGSSVQEYEDSEMR